MLVIAQTNLQLFNQLCRAQWPAPNLERVRATYELAMFLFSGQYRATGKPFLAHLVGTASILATLDQSPAVVAAGLIHAAFDFGDFGDGVRGVTPAHRQVLAECAGEDAAALVAVYHRRSRAEALERGAEQRSGSHSAADRAVLLMRLADTIEEFADGGAHYVPARRALLQNACREDVGAQSLAAIRQLGFSAFARDLEELLAESQHNAPPAVLIGQRRASYLIPPASLCERPSIRWRRRWLRLRGSLVRWLSRTNRPGPHSTKREAA